MKGTFIALGDQLFRQKQITARAMNATTILNKIIPLVSPNMHKTRRTALAACVLSLAQGNHCTVTSIGRGIHSQAFEKHRIKRSDRLLSNPHLQKESPSIYAYMCRVFTSKGRPIISVDWSDLDGRKQHFLIRAAVAFEGRSLTLYEEVHGIETKEKRRTHQRFLEVLKALLSNDVRPIIVTDAGFKTPWIELVKEIGWDYVGRVRRPRKFFDEASQSWRCISHLFPRANSRPKALKLKILQSNPQRSHLVLYKGKPKGRHLLNQDGSIRSSKTSLTAARGAKEPWLLISSLPNNSTFAKKSVSIYQTRMQIEESFRDMKSTKFGLGFEQHHTKKIERARKLVLLTTLAAMVLILLGKAIELAGLSYRFQCNSTRKRRVLSHFYLGKRALSINMKITLRQWREGIQEFAEQLFRASSIVS